MGSSKDKCYQLTLNNKIAKRKFRQSFKKCKTTSNLRRNVARPIHKLWANTSLNIRMAMRTIPCKFGVVHAVRFHERCHLQLLLLKYFF